MLHLFQLLYYYSNYRTGYLKHVKSYYTTPPQLSAAIPCGAPGADACDLHDRVVVVTGANSGLGREIATYAAAKGARLYMVCRDATRAEVAKQEIIAAVQRAQPTNDGSKFEPNITILLADVSELTQVRTVAKELQQRENKVDVLVCNAGVLLNDKQTTKDSGFEVTFATHLLGGAYLLPSLLLPQLRAAAHGRVILVTSGGMYNFKLPAWDVLTSTSATTPYNGVNAYAYAKRAQVLLAERWAKLHPNIAFVTAHPGWADTPAVDVAFGDQKKYLMPLRDPWQGAEGIAWLMGCSSDELESGALYLDRATQPKHLAGPFFSEGSYTKNKPLEVDEMMENLRKAAGL
jgi:dehydrogenase/reductase SDR family protein 12